MSNEAQILTAWLGYCLAAHGKSPADFAVDLDLAPSTVLRILHDPGRLARRADLMVRISATYQIAIPAAFARHRSD